MKNKQSTLTAILNRDVPMTDALIKEARAEHAALVAVAEAAEMVCKAIMRLWDAQRQGDKTAIGNATVDLWCELDRLAAVRAGSESGIGTLNAKQQGEALLKSCPWTESLMKLPYAGSEVAK